jgi:nucleotide-binding universal stress UspA family protein
VETTKKIELDVDNYGGSDLNYEILLREGNPGEVICQVADELGADLVVVGSHGTSTLKDTRFGSTAQTVVKHAGRSVLVVWTKT